MAKRITGKASSITFTIKNKEDSTEQAMLKAIQDQPDDDAPRLIYADWLDEHNQSDRAELIRLQCAKERLETQLKQMKERETELLVQHGEQWFPGVVKITTGDLFGSQTGPSYTTWGTGKHIKRGFVEDNPLDRPYVSQPTNYGMSGIVPVGVSGIVSANQLDVPIQETSGIPFIGAMSVNEYRTLRQLQKDMLGSSG